MLSTSASKILAAGCVAAVVVAPAEAEESCKNPLTQDHALIQIHRAAERLVANVSVHRHSSAAWCCSKCGDKYCSPRSGNCYDTQSKSYYENCKEATETASSCCGSCGDKKYCSPRSNRCYDTKRRDYYESCAGATQPSDCCGGCDGKMYCSPQSGNCYDTKRKDYYKTCDSSSSTANPASTTSTTTTMMMDCCGGCDGKMYCSPQSGNCYDTKRKDYYKTCSSGSSTATTMTASTTEMMPTTTVEFTGSTEGCCAGCMGAAYCSPNSNNCYYRKKKDYYQLCSADAAASWEDAPQCCADCAGKKPYFSPNSKNCYASKAKDYYEACPEVPAGAPVSSDCKVGGNNWCAADVPDAGFSFKKCPGLGGMRVKLLTYNLFWWNLFGQRGGNGRSAGRLIENAAKDEAFDVAAFQECDDARRIMNDGRMYEDQYDYVRWGSNTIAYKKTRWERLDYGKGEKFAEDANGRWQRGAHWIRLQEKSTGQKLFVLNHHGPLPINSGGKCGGEATAYNMLKMAEENSEEGDAIILTGDFNADAGSQTVSTLKSYIHLVMSDWVDMIMSNCDGSAVKETRNLGKGGSDHDALMAIIEF